MSALSKLEKLSYCWGPIGIADLMNRYAKINGVVFFFKRINEYGDACLCKVLEDGRVLNIGNIEIHGKSRNYFSIHFMHHGIPCSQRIKYTDVLYTQDSNYSIIPF